MNVTTQAKDNSKLVAAAIRDLASKRVMVGVPATKASRRAMAGQPAGPINNAELAYIHEHGAPEANIPARPFLGPGIASAKDKITAGLKQAGEAALAGKSDAMDRILNRIGLEAQAAVRTKINDGPFVPIQEATIRRRLTRTATYRKAGAKRRRTLMTAFLAGDNRPLLDTGQLRNSINFVIRKVK